MCKTKTESESECRVFQRHQNTKETEKKNNNMTSRSMQFSQAKQTHKIR